MRNVVVYLKGATLSGELPTTRSQIRQINEAVVQYERSGHRSMRVEDGYLTSPIGLGRYPLGGQLTLSTTRWDARATPVLVAGGGVTPAIGLQIGAAFATGAYLAGEELTVPQQGDRRFRMLNIEGEYAFGYTKISGEMTVR